MTFVPSYPLANHLVHACGGVAESQELIAGINSSIMPSNSLQIITGTVGGKTYTGIQLNSNLAIPTDIGFTNAAGGAAVALYYNAPTIGTIYIGNLSSPSSSFVTFVAGNTTFSFGSGAVEVLDASGFGSGFSPGNNAWSGSDPNGDSFILCDNTTAAAFTDRNGNQVDLCNGTDGIKHSGGNLGFFGVTTVGQQANASQAAITAITDANAKSSIQAIYNLLKNYGLAPATA